MLNHLQVQNLLKRQSSTDNRTWYFYDINTKWLFFFSFLWKEKRNLSLRLKCFMRFDTFRFIRWNTRNIQKQWNNLRSQFIHSNTYWECVPRMCKHLNDDWMVGICEVSWYHFISVCVVRIHQNHQWFSIIIRFEQTNCWINFYVDGF